MTTYNIETPMAKNTEITVPEPFTSAREKYLADLNAREDALLRAGNGIRDAVAFPRLRAMGVAESDLHRIAMRLVRQVQYGCDEDGALAAFLGVIRCYPLSHGTIAASEVV
ncbi:MAG TPA: hypothetical protein VJ276_17890 [Thermoanaerobaculia bacterium]|nr:hypothetical protein [Thermoanaerobaculia bacterium]